MMTENSERAEAVRYYVYQALIEPMVEGLAEVKDDPAIHRIRSSLRPTGDAASLA